MNKQCNAFTMIEVIVACIIVGVLAVTFGSKIKSSDFAGSLSLMEQKVYNLIVNGIIDSSVGYASSKDANCTTGGVGSFIGITAARVAACSQIALAIGGDTNVSNPDATASYFVFLKQYATTSQNKDGCRVYVGNGTSTTFSLYFDCSGVNNDLVGRYVQRIEEEVPGSISALNKQPYLQIMSLSNLSTGLSSVGGTTSDGKFMINFKD